MVDDDTNSRAIVPISHVDAIHSLMRAKKVWELLTLAIDLIHPVFTCLDRCFRLLRLPPRFKSVLTYVALMTSTLHFCI
uniref:Ion_trans domain-containing protein n=1 Tax=Panagrellus redivivus TaxID=6233 RepID=A0A7E4ZZ06_PANRE